MKRIWRIVVSLTLVLSLLVSAPGQEAFAYSLTNVVIGSDDELGNTWVSLNTDYIGPSAAMEGDSVSTVSNGVYPRNHWEGEGLTPGNAIGNVRVYRLGIGVTSERKGPLIVSPYKNWSKHSDCSVQTNGATEDKLLRLHKGLAAYEQQNWVAVDTDTKHVVGVVYDKNYSSDDVVANRVRDVVKRQDSKAMVVVGPARGPEDYHGATNVLLSEDNMNVLFVNATKHEKFRAMCAETDDVMPVKVDGKEYVFNAAMLRALSSKSPEEIAKALHIIGENQSLSNFESKIKEQIQRILTAGHYAGIYLKAWNCSAITLNSVSVNGLEVANNPTVDVMGTLTAMLCLYTYMPNATYRSAIKRYLEQVATAMETKRKDSTMAWGSDNFACIAIEQLVPVRIGTKDYCLSAPELMVAACDGTDNLATMRNQVRIFFCGHAVLGIKNDCWKHFNAGIDISLSDAWEGKTIAKKYASMINWYHNNYMTKKCGAHCKETARGLIAAVQNSLGIKWQHNSQGKLACEANVVMEEATGSSGGETVYIHNSDTHDMKGKCFLSGITTNGINSMGGYGILSSTVSHEAKIPKPQAYGSFGVEVIKNSQADTKNSETTYKVRMDSNDTDKLADPFYVKATYKFADGENNSNDDVVDSLVDAIEGTGGKWNQANVKVRFRMYADALPFTATSYKAPNYNKFANWDDADSARVEVDIDGSKRKCTLKTIAPDGPKNVGAPGKQFKEEYTAVYDSLTKADMKKLLKGGAVSWETQWCDVSGLNKTGTRYFVYRIDADILYNIDGQTKTIKVEDTQDTFDKDHKCTARHFEYRKCAPDDGGWLKIYVSFKGSQYYDCTPPNLLANSFPKVAGKPCIVTADLGSARELAKAKYSSILTPEAYWEPTVEVKKLRKANGDKINTSGKIDIDVKKGMRIGGKKAKAPVAEIYLHANQDYPGDGGGGGGGGNKTSYTIQYYFNDEHDSSCDKVVKEQIIGSDATVTFPDESEHKEGYSFDKCEPVAGSDDHTAKINLKANGTENIIKAYYIETKFKYTSAIAKPYAEIKCGSLEQGGSQEPYEAMSGFPTTEDLYFGSGGNETIADVEYEYKKNGKATRKYTFTNALPDDCNWGLSYPYTGGDTSFSDMTKTEAFNAFTQLVDRLNAGTVTHKSPGVNTWTCPSCDEPYGKENKIIQGLWDDSEGPNKSPGTYIYGQWKLVCDGATSYGHEYMREKNGNKCTYREPVEEGPPSEPCGNVPYFEAMDAVTANDHHGEPTDEEKKQDMIGECWHKKGDAPPPSTRPVVWYPVRWNFHAEYTPVFTPTADNTLTWTQDVEGFNYNQINKACVWGLTESLVNGTEKLTTEAKIKGSLIDQGADVRYNIANANTSKAGRLLYSVTKNAYDDVTWEGKDFTDEEGVCPRCIQAHTFEHLVDPAKNEVGSNPEETYNEVTCISDFLMQRTSAGDLSFTYDEYKAGNATSKKVPIIKPGTAEKHIKKNGKYQQDCDKIIETDPITFEEANESHKYEDIVGNQTTFKGIDLKPQDMPFCGYSGNFKNTSGKYQTSWSAKTNVDVNDESLACNDPDFKPGGPAKAKVEKLAAVPATVRLGKNDIDVPDMDVRNGHYVLGPSSVFYKRLVAYNRDPAKVSMVYEKDDDTMGTKALNQASNPDYGGQEGIVLTTTYSPAHGNINDVVVHDPVTCQYSLFFNTAGARDQRVTEGGIVEDSSAEIATCPGIAIDCPYSHLECSYNGTLVHTRECYTTDYDYQHQSNPICNNPHHQNSRNIRYYLYGWYVAEDYSPYAYRPGEDWRLYTAPYYTEGKTSAVPKYLCDNVYIAQNALTGAYCLVARDSVQGSIVANGAGGYTSTGQVTAVESVTGTTFNVSTYYDGTKNVLCLWDPVCDKELPLFDTTKTTNKIFHEPEGDATCWKACMDPAKHQKNPSVTIDDKTYSHNPKFLNLDREFYLYFPNTGNFYGDGAFGIDKVQKLEGKGYTDNMDTTTWVQNKYCVFDFDVIYDVDGNPNTTNDCICYKAGEQVILGTFKPETKANGTKTGKFIDDGEKTGYKYMFYVPLENHEMASAQIHCYAVGLNAGTDTWSENLSTHNYERNDVFYAKHDASKNTTLDLIGQIGGLTLMDTGDFRFSETFKQPLSEWLIKNLVKKVDYRKQNYVIADLLDIRGNNYQAITNSALNTYGTQWYKEKHDKILPFPLTPAKNVNTALRKQPLRPGYATYLSLETIGDYYGEEVNSDTSRKVQIRPLYYKLDLTDGKFTQLDVYMLDNGLYKCINKFDSNEPVTEHEWPYYFNWEDEKDRRMVTVSEEAITKKVEPALTFVNKCTINAETGLAETVTGKAIIPKGTHYKFGNAQMLHLRARNRTFVGTDYTNKVWHNGRVGSADVQNPDVRLNVVSYPALQSPSRPTIFDEIEYNARGQRWHFSLGLPSSTVFVEKGKDPVQEEIEKVSNDHSVIVVALDVKAKGDVWTLQYNGIPTEGQKIQILPNGPIYDYSVDPDGPGSKPIVEVYTSKFSAKDDLSVEGTH